MLQHFSNVSIGKRFVASPNAIAMDHTKYLSVFEKTSEILAKNMKTGDTVPFDKDKKVRFLDF